MHQRGILGALLLILSVGCAGSDRRGTAEVEAKQAVTAAAAVAEVRRGYFGRDWWACARAGEALGARHPDSAPLRAWTIACAARAGEDALPRAEAMLSERPGEPWGLFARAAALIDDPTRGPDEGIPAARVVAGALVHPDATWLLGRALVVHGTGEEAAAFLAALPGRAGAPELLGLELALLTTSSEDVEASLLALAEQVRALDPSFVDGWFLPATWLLARRRTAEAEVSFARALELSPYSPAIHARKWDAISMGQARGPEAKKAAIDADVAALLRARGDAPAALHAAAYAYDDLSPETARRYRVQVLARFPDSREAEWARIEAIRGFDRAWMAAKGERDRRAAEQALRDALAAFIARPRHVVPALLAEAHMLRYFVVRADAGARPEELLVAAQGFAAHERQNLHLFGDVAAVLAERTPYHAEAEAIAREGLRLAELRFARTPPSEAAKDRDRHLRGVLLGGLGAVLHAQGRLAEAREALQQSQALHRGREPEPFIRLAALAETEGQPAEAERLLIAGLNVEYNRDKVVAALKALYVRRRGSERGFAGYLARIERSQREERRAAVLATRIAEPRTLAAFALPRLGGGEVRSETLAGRIMVINLWFTSCSPCVKELPALQKLADAYAAAPDVVITTVNTDPSTDRLAAWLADRGLRFEVLLGERWAIESKVRSFPTTLFVDPQGRVVFVQESISERLVEEFTWRIEAMRAATVGRTRSGG